jgi:radical SAM protein with 4Fe4S-binding SPASM domain
MLTFKNMRFAASLFANHELQKLSHLTNSVLCKPSYVTIAATERCNLKCRQCDVWNICDSHGKEFTTAEFKELIDHLRDWLGAFLLSITGGEPFLRSDMIELIHYATKRDVNVHVNSNGTLIKQKLAYELITSGLNNLSISLDGVNSETHDYIRGVNNAYDKVVSAIDILNELKHKMSSHMSISISTIIMGYNIKEMVDIVYFVEDNNLNMISFQPLMSTLGSTDLNDKSFYKHSELWNTNRELIAPTIDKLISLKKNGSPISNSIQHLELMKEYFRNPTEYLNKTCGIGLKSFFISPYGTVHICPVMDTVGNIKSDYPGALWKSKKATKIRQDILQCKKNCMLLNCNFNSGYKEKMHKLLNRLN